MFEKGKGAHLEKDLKVARQHAMFQWDDVWDTYDCTLEGLYTGLEPYYKLNGQCVSYDDLVKYFSNLQAIEDEMLK